VDKNGRGRRSLYLTTGWGYPRRALFSGGLGLRNMQEGLKQLDGTLTLQASGPKAANPDHRHRTADTIACAPPPYALP